MSNNEELPGIFNKHFNKLVENLDIDKSLATNITSSDITDPVLMLLKSTNIIQA